MKVISLLAGLTSLLWSANAYASNFVEYTFTGSGTGLSGQVNNDVGGYDFNKVSVSFSASYYVNLDAGDDLNNGIHYFGNGINSFGYEGVDFSNGISPERGGVYLSKNGLGAGHSIEANYFLESVGVAAYFKDAPLTFTDLSSDSILTGGTFSYDFGNKFSGLSAQGTLTGFSIRSVAALGFASVSVSVSSVPEVPAPVPEVSTWAMMLAGFGVIGLAARRRQSVKTTIRFV